MALGFGNGEGTGCTAYSIAEWNGEWQSGSAEIKKTT
jgi:hypothetical protein